MTHVFIYIYTHSLLKIKFISIFHIYINSFNQLGLSYVYILWFYSDNWLSFTRYTCILFVIKTCNNITNWLKCSMRHFPSTHIYISFIVLLVRFVIKNFFLSCVGTLAPPSGENAMGLNWCHWFMHFLVTSAKHRIYTFLFYTPCGESLLQIGAVELLQFCRGARALLTVLQLNPRTICSAYQLMSPKISHFNCYLNLIVITRIILLNIEDADILFVKSSISFSLQVTKFSGRLQTTI